MDFQYMKRKELQALCKKHGVPANLTNREMANQLASIFKENEELVSLEKLTTNPEEIGSETGAEVAKKQARKVRFSPENQTIVYEVSVYRRPGRRSRKQMLSKNPAQVIENAPKSEDIRKAEDCQVRVTRSGVQSTVEDDVNMVSTPSVGRKRGRGGMKNKDSEMINIGKSEVLEMGYRDDVKICNDEVTGGVSRRQLRRRKNVTHEDSKKIRKGKGGDEVHMLDESSEESYVVCEDVGSKNGSKQPTRNARKEDQSVALSNEVEKAEVVSRVTRQSRAQSKNVASMVKSEVKIVEVQRRCEEVLQLKKPQKGRGKSALRQKIVPQRVRAENSLLVLEGAEAEKPLRRSNRNAEKDCAKTAKSETQVTKVPGGDIAFEKPSECLSSYSSSGKTVVCQSSKGENEEELVKRETRKRTRTTDLDAIVEHSGEIERAEYAFTSQDQAPLRRSRRKTVILNTPAPTNAELANKEDIGQMLQFRAPFVGKEVTEELPRRSSRNVSRYNSPGTSKEDQIAFTKKDSGVKQQRQEPILEEETSVAEHHPIEEKAQRRSNRIASRSSSVAPPCPTASVVKKKQQSKSRITIIEAAALSESLLAPGELPAGKDELVVEESAGNKNDLSLNVSKQTAKNSERCSNKKRQGLTRNSGAKKQCGFAEASPLSLDLEELKDSTGNMEKTLIRTSAKFVGLSTDQEMHQAADKSMVGYEKETNLVEDDREKLVHGGNVESEENCMSCKSVNTKCILDDAKCSDPKLLEFEGKHAVDFSGMTFPAESQDNVIDRAEITVNTAGHGMSDQEKKEDIKAMDTHSAYESLVVYKEDRSPVESEKEQLVQVDTADSEINCHELSWYLTGRGAVDDPNNVINLDSSEITSLANGFSLADQMDLTGATFTAVNLETQLETEPPRGENTNFASDNAEDSRTSFGEDQILVELKVANVTAAESVREATFKDHLNEFGESSGLKRGSENALKKAEEMIATDFSDKEGIPHIESSDKATEIQESSAEFHFAITEIGAQKTTEIQQSSHSHTAAPETPCGPAPETQVKEKTCWVEAAVETSGSEMSNQEMIENMILENSHCVCESVLIHKENTRLVKNDEEIRIDDDTFEGGMKYQSCLALNGTGAMDDSNLVEPRMVVCPEINSPADGSSSASQADLAGKTSSHIEQEKILETEEPLTVENVNSINDNMDAKRSRTPVEEDHIKVQLEDANVIAAESIGEVIFNDLLNELGESIGLKRGSETPLKKTEKLSATEFSDAGAISLPETSTKASEKQDYRAEIDIVTKITGTPNITEIKWSSSSDTTAFRTPFGLAPQSQDKLCNAGIIVGIARSEMCNQDEETSLVEDDKEIVIQDDTVEGKVKYHHFLSLNKTGALDEVLVEPRMVEFESNVNNMNCFEMASLADVCSAASQSNLAGETSNKLKQEKVLESEKSSMSENVNDESDKEEVEDDNNPAQEDQNSKHLEDATMTAAEPVKEVVVCDHWNELCASCGSKKFEVSLKKAEGTSTNHSSGKGMVHTESSVEINENSDATAKIHTITAETGEKIIMGMQWSLSGHDTTFRSPHRPEVGSQDMLGTINRVENAVRNTGYGICSRQKIEEIVKIVQNEHKETINTERGLFVGEKKLLDEDSEGEFLADGACHLLSDSIDGECAKDKRNDIAEGSFNNVSVETQEKHTCEVFDGEGTDAVSSEEKDNDIFESASHADVSPQCICNGKLPVRNNMQEKLEPVCMDNENSRTKIPTHFSSQNALKQLDNESEAVKQGAGIGEVHAFSNASQALRLEELTASISSEPFSMRLHDHVLDDGGRNCQGEIVMDQPNDFAATMDGNGISASRETNVGQDDNMMEEIAISALKVKLGDHGGCKVDAKLYETNMSALETMFQETDVSGLVHTKFPEEMPNASVRSTLPFEKPNCGDLDDQSEEVAPERDCSSSIGLDGLRSTVGVILDNNSQVGTLESTFNSNDPQSGTEAEDPNVNDSGPYGMLDYISANTHHVANEFNAALMVEEAGSEDGGKTPISHQRSLGSGKQGVPSYANSPCSKPETNIGSSTLLCSSIPVSCAEKEKLHPQVMDDVDEVGGTKISIDRKVARRERDGRQINTGGFSDVIDGSLVEKIKGDPDEIAETKSDDCEGSVKTATFMDGNDSLVVNQPPCLDASKSCDLQTEEPRGFHLHDNIAGESREVGSCSKVDIVSLVKPEMVVDCLSISSICATSDEEHKHLENPDESHILTNMEMSLSLADEDEVKEPDAKAGDSNCAALDKTITECISSDLKKQDYVACSDAEDIQFSVQKDGPETMEMRKDVSGLDAAMADKSPVLKNSEVATAVEREEAFMSQLKLPSSQKKNVTTKKEGSKSVSVKQLTSSILKSKSKSRLTQRTPKRLIIHDMKENEVSTKKGQIGNMTTPKASSKRRPLELWKY
ncbi:PREDICTED: uncharacterized protein LOC18592650 isoform X1 [Theobroma cacao]|uniref:Uncharacterized protein LOC18592650 isoform X1 n=1 Tax=Theobroma cacao TaxID=3641 RepID=A0AB32WTR1_THECC|nr:PREDICTED: uncharacterized protein LOC18592650 isoform X1 [Theobroma cacao]